jgi:hypothetical protein
MQRGTLDFAFVKSSIIDASCGGCHTGGGASGGVRLDTEQQVLNLGTQFCNSFDRMPPGGSTGGSAKDLACEWANSN